VTGPLLGTLAVAAVAAADTVALAQTFLSQPLVTATVLGWLWGDLTLGLGAGCVLQVLAVTTQPLGARVPEDYAAGGVVGAGVALVLGRGHPFASSRDAALLLGVMAGLLASLGGMALARWQRRRNEGLARWCEAELRRGTRGALLRASWAGVALAAALGVSYCATFLALAAWVGEPLVHHESLRLARAWALAQPLWMGFAMAQLLNGFVRRRPRRALVFAAALMAGWLVRVLGVA
jgi:mannose/fructose/N-acetylgalactosamine-specific phosphotransferase system component IIC